MRYLLDVNVLIALMDESHPAHRLCTNWYAQQSGRTGKDGATQGRTDSHSEGVAVCPLVENGAARIMSNPAYAQEQPTLKPAALLRQIALFKDTAPNLEFWPDAVSLADTLLFDHSKIHGPRQLTDIYLLGLATSQRQGLVTLDRNIPLAAVRGALKSQLWVL